MSTDPARVRLLYIHVCRDAKLRWCRKHSINGGVWGVGCGVRGVGCGVCVGVDVLFPV